MKKSSDKSLSSFDKNDWNNILFNVNRYATLMSTQIDRIFILRLEVAWEASFEYKKRDRS